MKLLGYKRVNVKSIVCDAADIRRRTKAAHVAELADDIRKHGEEPINAPMIRAKGNRLICGRDRLAACITLKLKKIWCHVVDCDDTEAKELELAENIYRRAENRSDLIAQLVALKEQQYRATHAESLADAPLKGVTVSRLQQGASAQTIKAQARKDVAKAAGITPAAVRQAEVRAAKDSSAGRESSRSLSSEPAAVADDAGVFDHINLNLLGVPATPANRALCELAAPQQTAIDEADKYLRLALGALKRIESLAIGQELRRQVERVGSLVRSERPEALCPWCKGVDAVLAECNGCQTIGYVSAERAKRAPRECLDVANPVVVVRGQFVAYADALTGKLPKNGAPPKPAKNGAGKHVSVVDAGGNDLLARAMADEEATLAQELTTTYDDEERY